jgi:hypothetical protein
LRNECFNEHIFLSLAEARLIARATTWLRVSSSDGIADAASASVSVMGRWCAGRRAARRSVFPRREMRDRARKGSVSFSFRLLFEMRLTIYNIPSLRRQFELT